MITVISEWKKFTSLTHCTLIFQYSHHLWLHIFFSHSIHLFIPSVKKVSGWLLIHLRTAASTLTFDEKCWPFNVSFNFGNHQKSDGAKSGLTPLWISGLSWCPEFVHCNVVLRCCDAKQTCFFPAWFCACVAKVIVRLHNTCRNSPSLLQSEILCKACLLHPKRWWAWLFLLMEQFWISLHSENLDNNIPWIAFCFPGHNDEPRIHLLWQYSWGNHPPRDDIG